MEQLVMGIDGGGTKTAAWLAAADRPDAPLGRGKAGPSNPCAVGFDGAMAALDESMAAAFDDAGRPRRELAALCIALAGSDYDATGSAVATWIRQHGRAARIELTTDAEPLLACTPEGFGIGLIAGTGSFVFGRDRTGETRKAGGWGYRFGDEGSGYTLAIEGLRAASRMADGRAKPTRLLAGFLDALDCREPREMIARVYSESMDRAGIADLAHVVFRAAAQGDAAAQRILSEQAASLAELVGVLARALDLQNPVPLAVTGGVIVNRENYRTAVLEHLRSAGFEVQLELVDHPVRGAVRMAARLSRS